MKSAIAWDDHSAKDVLEQKRYFNRHDVDCFQKLSKACLAAQDVGSGYGSLDVAGGLDLDRENIFQTSFSWAACLTRFMGADFFDQVRITERRGLIGERVHTRTNTRVHIGNVQMRYHDSLQFASHEVVRLTACARRASS